MGFFGKGSPPPRRPTVDNKLLVRPFPSYPGPPLINVPLVAKSPYSGFRIAFWIGFGGQIKEEFEDLNIRDYTVAAIEGRRDLEFALGITDSREEVSFTASDGGEFRFFVNWLTPVARSQTSIDERLKTEFDDPSAPISTFHGALHYENGTLNFWTLTITDNAIYALAETSENSVCVKWSDFVGLTWRDFDTTLAICDSEGFRFLPYFNIRQKDTWRSFVLAVDQTHLKKHPPRIVKRTFGSEGTATLHLRIVNGIKVASPPVEDKFLIDLISQSGYAKELKDWREEQLKLLA
jgi:hypothetical protein